MGVTIMGVLNVTPDSFHDGGAYLDVRRAVVHAFDMRDEGAAIIDIGGESTRPGADSVTEEVEIARICPVIQALAKDFDATISVDTNKSGVARAALAAGATMVNDISGLVFDPGMGSVIAGAGAHVVIGHIKGRPRTMQHDPRYEDLIGEIVEFLSAAAENAQKEGIARDRIILDPGIGFGKSLEDNYRIIAELGRIKKIGFPVCVGLSNKSLIGKINAEGEDRLPATIALNTVCVQNGADIIRVHDVKEHRLALRSLEMLEMVSKSHDRTI